MAQPRFSYEKYTHRRKTQKFESICDEIAKSGKTYAEWQKERYSELYDVKSDIKERIERL